ncbi:TetR/AcrR family transcriptional regulator [Paenibacillus physcomitrellae]|uniref:TetR family transcriptional regulator n=1 Tax=Paenibacillus physcomitrellae TaxID=1619311 RepID=A0ABQ1G0V8_9BACL|nr:TetR/AcrR family transcriptional regulator [Paenibacillus physcomitrellae]GGA34239.1 TetR family transcriptional regulator [Paenibacillus physcomitrellae]
MVESSKDHKQNNEGEQQTAKSRRRGDVLENAILSAAWEELRETGYSRLTMEAVASRAQTNKNAVYRRWPNKAKLVIAALMKHIPKPSLEAPDTGNLRQDVLALLDRLNKLMQMIGAETIHGLMVEFHGAELHSNLTLPPRSEDLLVIAMKNILQNAERRGEVKVEELPERVISLPVDLIRFELLTTHTPLTDEAVVEIVDLIFLPLVLKENK